MTASIKCYRGRFAPSPTGPLHFGSLLAAVASYLEARTHQGTWLVRMEDIDPPREVPGASNQILHTLECFGFEWDEAPLFQSTRIEQYQTALRQLERDGHIYTCGCSRRDIAAVAKPGKEGLVYPGTCRPGTPHQSDSQAWRAYTPDRPDHFIDALHGKIDYNLAQDSGDFVVRRSDGFIAYQLAVIIDDDFQQITHVVRGSDLLYSTPKQIHLFRLLGHEQIPSYLHIPVATHAEGEKLSKQTHAPALDDQNPAPQLITALRFLNQSPPTDLVGASLAEVWEWALAHWMPQRIPQKTHLPWPYC